MTKDDAAVNVSLRAVRCLGNPADLHCSRDWKCAANRRFQLIKPNLLILRQFPHLRRASHVPAKSRAPSEHSPGSSLACYLFASCRTWTSPDSYWKRWGVARGHNTLAICTAAPSLPSAHKRQAVEGAGGDGSSCPRTAEPSQGPCLSPCPLKEK